MPEDVKFSISLPDGRQTEWDQKQYNKAAQSLFEKYPDAQVNRISGYSDQSELTPDSSFHITLDDGRETDWNYDQFSKAGKNLMEKYPGAKISVSDDITARRNRDFAHQYEFAQSKVDDANLPDEEKQQYIDFVGQNADRYGKVKDKYGNQYNGRPDGADSLIDVYSRMEALQRELDSLPEEKDYRGLSREAAIQYAQEANSPEGRRRSEIKKELEQLRKERENNPAWIAYWNKTKEELPGLIDAMDAKAKENANVSGRSANMSDQEALDLIGGAEERQGNEQEQDYYLTARKYYKEALDTAKAPSKYDDSWGIVNFAKGVGANIASAVSIVELAKALQDVNLINTVKQIQQAEGKDVNLIDLVNNQSDKLNYLSDGQKEMLKAFAKRYEVEQGRSDNMSIGYNAGKGAVQSLGFMGDFLMTGGAGSAVAKGLLKTTAKEMSGKTLTEAGKKLLVGNLEGATKALVMTPLMPSSYANFIDTMTQLNGDGQMDLSAKAVRKAIEDGLIETFSENAGELFGIPLGTKYFDGIAKSKLGEVGRAMSRTGAGNFFKNAGWHGLVGEMAEEVLGNAMRSIPEVGTDPEALKNFFSGDEFWTTLASFAPMSVISGGASAYQIRKAGKQMSKYGDQLKTMLTNLGLNEEQEKQVESMLDLSEYKTPEEIGSAIAKIGKFAGETGLLTQDIAADLGMAMGEYLRSASEYKTIKGIFDEEQDAARAQNTALIDEEVGDSNWYHQGEGGNFVRTITDADGNQRFVVSSADGQLALVGRDGSKSFLTNEELEAGIADGSLTDSGEQPINDYLDGITEQEQKTAEEQRMTEEVATQLTAIQERIAADPTINMGTEEAPKMGVVDAVNANGVHVTWQDEDGAKDATLTWEQVGNYLGTPVETKTDEQIEQEEIQAEEDIRSRKEEYNKIIPEGTEFTAVLVEGEEPVTYQFKRAFLNEDGTMMLQVTDKETGKDEQITEDMALQGNLTSVLDSFKTPAEVQQEEAVTQEETPEDDGILRDFRGNPIPLKDDGSVNQTALWNADPEAWARWNDSQRNDGGENSRGYIAKATKKLQSDAKAVQKQIAKELDFDKIENLEGQLASINNRIADLERIENNYANAEVAQAEAVQTPEEVPAPVAETTEAAPVAEAAQTQEDAEAARVQALKDRVRAWVERTGVEADVFESPDQVENKQAAKAIAEGQPVAGWFEPNTGKVVIYLPNILDEAEIDRTYMHEVISHKGLRDLLGNEGWNTLMDSVWNNIMTEKDRADYLKYNSHLKGTEEFLRRAAADEYVAHLAENVNTENMGAWQKFVEMVKEILLKLGMDVKLTTEDLSNLLQASLANYERMQAEKRAAEQPAVSEEMQRISQRIADILSGKDETNYKDHLDDRVEVPSEATDEMDRQWEEYKQSIEEQKKPIQKQMVDLRERFKQEAAETVDRNIAEKGLPVSETARANAITEEYNNLLDTNEEYQNLKKQLGDLNDLASTKVKENFRHNVIGMLHLEYATEDATGFVKEGDKLTSYMDAPTGQESPSAPDETMFSLKREEDSKDDEGKTVPGLRTLADGFLAKLADKPLTPEELAIGSDAIGEMVNYMMPYLDKVKDGKRYLPEEIFGKGWSTIFKNGSYGRTMENTLICMRTLAYNDFVNAVQEKVGRPLTPTESFLASQMLYDIATDPQCLYCYVALDRKAYNGFLKTYIEQRDAVLDKYKADDSIDKTYRLPAQAKSRKNRKGLPADNQVNKLYLEYLDGRADTPSMRNRFNGWLDRIAEGTLIGMKDLTSPETRQKVAGKGASYAAQIDDAEKYAQSASWAKKQEEYRAYNGELLSMPQKVVDLLNSEYGLRFYSFSEYSPAFIVENMQMVRDAALRGLVGLAYTKEIDFAKIFAPTGININISCYGREAEDGTVVMDTKQGADWGEAQALRERYGNVGCVFVATNDRMVEWAIHQPWVDVVIPFHIVRTGEDIAKFYDWTNYTAMEADKDVKGRSRDIMPTEHMNDKDTFLQLCEERGLKPRFADLILPSTGRSVTEDPDYMKLVNETRRSVNETVRIKPIFDTQEARRSFDEFVEKGGYYAGWFTEEGAFERGVEQVAADVEAGKTAKDVDYGRQDIKASAEKLAAMAGKRKRPRSHQGTPRRIGGDKITKAQQNVLNYLETGEFKSEREPLEVANATQKQPISDAAQPVVTEEDVMDVAMFRLSKNNKATVESWLKKREDINDEQRAEVVDYIDKLDDAKTQLATAKWFANGTIRIPEDMKKVQQAISVAGKAKVDPLRYNSPMELLDAHAEFKPSEERINPDEVSTLHRAAEYPDNGIVVYDVDNTKESRENMRKIINTHFGEDASPWCLLQGDGKGNLTADSARYWKHYNAYPKQVAFKDGKLLAFSANDTHTRVWWDRQDQSHYGIPLTKKVEGDELGRSADYIVDEGGKLIIEPGGHMYRGNRQNGVYEEWNSDGSQLLSRIEYKDGKEEGISEEWYPSGQIRKRAVMKEDRYVGTYEQWYDNGQQKMKAEMNEEGDRDGEQVGWYRNGNKSYEWRAKEGKPVGDHIQYYETGEPKFIQHYDKEGTLAGYEDYVSWGAVKGIKAHIGIGRRVAYAPDSNRRTEEEFRANGKLHKREEYHGSKLDGIVEYYYPDGTIQTRTHYVEGERNGTKEVYHENGKLWLRGDFKDGEVDGLQEQWNKEGDLILREEWKDGKKVRTLPLDENVQFRKVEPIVDGKSEELFEQAKKTFGTTNNLSEAGYVIPDGSMLDFSGRHLLDPGQDSSWMNGMRQVDHREISDLNYEKDGNTPSGYETDMRDFIRRGAIRLNSGVINLATKPTKGQENVLWGLIQRANGDVDVDFGDGYDTDHYASYNHARPERILNDIRRYFDEGIEPEGNVMFRKGRITPKQDREYLDAVEAGDMEKAQAMVVEAARSLGYDSPILYHGSDAFGFTKIDTDNSDDRLSFWATDSEKVAGSYTQTDAVRNPGSEVTTEELEELEEKALNEIDEEIHNFRRLIDKYFSEWFFGNTGNTVIQKAVMNANSEAGWGDGVYDVLEDFVADAYRDYGEDEFGEEYEDFSDWQEYSPEAKKIYESISSIEGLRFKYDRITQGNVIGGIYQLVAKTDNLFEVDAKGAVWNELHPEGLPKIERGQYKDVPYRTRDVVKWAKNNGYDGVLFKNIKDNGKYGRTEPSNVYAFFNPQSQVKSAEPVTYNDQGNVIPLSERFNEESDDIRFSLRGIIGAENAEDEVALDNLEVAEEMENAGKDNPTIWRATGWERGADGKWRNEIPDAKQKEGVSLQKRNIAGEVLDAPELFDSYPELAEMPIDLVNSAAAGAYNREQKRITLDTDYNTTFELSREDKKKVEDSTIDFIRNGIWKRQSDIVKFKNGLSEQYGKLVLNSNGIATLLHELQHAIQQIEGFAKGTNEKLGERLYYKEALKTKPEETYFAWFLSRKNSAKKLNQVGRERVIRYAEIYDKSRLVDEDLAYLNKLIDYLKGISDDEYKKLVSRAAKIVKAAEKAGEANYEKSAGEVEARNVERRSTLSDEKRQKYSPEATEEYSRSEQIIQFRKRTKEDPKETIKVYKLMRLEDGKKLPLFIDRNSEPLEDGQWYDADSPDLAFLKEMPSGIFLVDANNGTYTSLKDYQKERGAKATKWPTIEDVNEASSKGLRWMKITDTEKGQKRYEGENRKYENIGINGSEGVSTFAMRPGWHAGSLPTMRQIGKGSEKNIRDDRFVWVEGEIPADIDYNEEAQRNPDKDIPTHIPTDGFYMKATNADKAKSQADRVGWYVAGSFKPNRVIGDLEAKQIIDDWNAEHPDAKVEYDWPREGGRVFNADTMQLEEAPAKEDVLFRRSQDLFNESREGGLTRVIGGENATELYHNVYRAIPKEIRERIVNKAGDGFLFSEATRDAIAEAVENGDPTGLAGLASNMLRDYVGPLDERTARYILWRGDRKAEDDDILDTVKDITMQRRLQVGQFADPAMFRLSDNLEEAENRAESMADDAQQTKDEKKEFAKVNDALTTIKAMSLQKEYDRKTVNTITVLAKNVLKDQSIETLSRHEIARLLGIITTSIGKAPKTVKKNADALVGLIVDHLLRSEETKLGMLANSKASKTNQAGVEVQGALDVRGQNVLKAYKAGLDMDLENPEDEFDGNTIKGRLNTLSDRLSSEDDAVRSEAEDEYAGLMLAQEYQEKIKASVNEERGLKNEMKEAAEAYRDGDISRTSYNQFVEEAEKSVRENKIERIEAYRDLRLKMLQMMEGSIDARKEFTEREKQRVEEIHHLANSDMQGEDASPFKEPTRMGRFANSSIVRFFSKPLITFDQMLRLFGQKNVAGEGYLFNKFHRGWIDATEKAYLGDKQAKEELDAKVSEVFDKKMRWSDLYAEERKMPTVKVKWWDGGQMKEHELTQGNLLYIYMVNKMTDGRMKLRRMGITDEHVDAIKKQMDERFIELADWLQSEYLVNKRNKYNAVHERLFGASMAAIEDYFPLKINKRSLNRAEDIGRPEFDDVLPATTTGSIIKRKRNAQDLDLLGADAFSVVIEHIEQMEQWAAFAEFNKDLNTLLSYKRFRNQVQNMDSVYGSGNELWKNFKSVCRIAGGTYNPAGKKSDLDTAALNIAKGVTSAKISFRIYTALKQFLSMPAFVSDANPKYLAQNLATPWKAWNWAMENLPMYEKRWKSRMVGDTRLMNTESDWKFFRSKVYDTLSRLGMSPNAFVDAMTIAIGSHSMYQTRYDRYIQDGYTEEQADKKAKQDATTLYNETQQSNEAAFVSPVQLDRTVLATMLTVFRNSSMGYQRQLHDAIRNIGKMMKPGYKAASIEFMTKQMVRDGLTEEQAEHAANRNYNREIWRSAARIGTFGFLVQFAWNLGGSIAYLLFGDDDDKKEEMLTEALIHGLIGGSMEGLAGGNVISEALNMVAKGESLNNYDPSLLPIISDMKSAYKKMSYDPVAGANDLVNLAVQAGLGVNPQTLTDAVVAVVDACGGDLETSTEAMLLIMRVLQVPQSQVDQIYIDELGVNADKARTMSVGEMAERYAKYKVAKGAPLTGWAYSDEAEEKREKAYLKRFKKLVKERKESK